MSLVATIEGIYTAEIKAFDGERLELRSAKAFAPGAPLALELELEGERLSLRAKSLSSKRIGEDSFQIRIRLVSLKRSERELLSRHI